MSGARLWDEYLFQVEFKQLSSKLSQLRDWICYSLKTEVLGPGETTTQCFIKHLFVSMSVKQNVFVFCFLLCLCSRMFDDAERC